jgi:hypothetical protein
VERRIQGDVTLRGDARGGTEAPVIRRTFHGATVPGYASVVVRRMAVWFSMRAGRALRRETSRSDTHSAPAVSSPGGADQHIAKFAQVGCLGSFVERCGDVFCRTSHLVNAIRQVGRLVGRQHHRVRR